MTGIITERYRDTASSMRKKGRIGPDSDTTRLSLVTLRNYENQINDYPNCIETAGIVGLVLGRAKAEISNYFRM